MAMKHNIANAKRHWMGLKHRLRTLMLRKKKLIHEHKLIENEILRLHKEIKETERTIKQMAKLKE